MDAQCVRTNEQYLDDTGAAIDPCDVVVLLCGGSGGGGGVVPPTPVAPITLEGQDCDGVALPATGNPGELMQVVQPAGQVFKVQLCNNPQDIEKVVLCDSITGHKIAVISDLTDPSAPIVSFWDINTGAPWTGDVSTLEACPDTDTESDPQAVCVDGEDMVQWVVKSDGKPTGVVYYTYPDGSLATVAAGAVISIGSCVAATVCDPTISSAPGDTLAGLLPGHSISIQKDSCCMVEVVTSAGSYIIRKGMTAHSTADFACPVTVTAVNILSGNCTPADVIVTTQKLS